MRAESADAADVAPLRRLSPSLCQPVFLSRAMPPASLSVLVEGVKDKVDAILAHGQSSPPSPAAGSER
jgi:hypothetical protein